MSIPTDFVNLTDLPESNYDANLAIAVESSNAAEPTKKMLLSKLASSVQVNNLQTKREAIEWRSGLRVTDELQLYVHNGIEYLPNPKATPFPFTTGVTFNADNWVLNELMSWKNAGDARAWGAVPVPINVFTYHSIDYNSVFAGHDSTDSIRQALTELQAESAMHYSSVPSKRGVLDLGGLTYIVSGDNPLGCQYITPDGDVPYYYKIQNGTLIWNRGAATQAAFDQFDFTNCRSFDLSDLNIYVTNNASISGKIFAFGETGNNSRVGGGKFSNVHIYCGDAEAKTGNCCETVYQLRGDTLADRFLIEGGSVNGFVNLWQCNNQEAVSWDFLGCSILTGRDNATFFDHASPWSGGMNIDGCDVIGLGDNVTVFKSRGFSAASFTQRAISVNSRFEMRGDNVKWFDTNVNNYVVVGMDAAAGSGDKLNHSIELGVGCTLDFNNSTLPQNINLGSWKNPAPIAANRELHGNNVTFRGGFPLVNYGGISTVRNVIETGYSTGVMHIENSNATVNGLWGVNGNRYNSIGDSDIIIGINDAAGYSRITDSVDIPINSFVTSAIITATATSASVAVRLGLKLNNSIVSKVDLSTSATINIDAIKDKNLMGAWHFKTTDDFLRVRIVALDAGDNEVSSTSIIAKCHLTARPILTRFDYGSGDTGVINK